jgi:K+-transporting ATPase KdpF subunit
LGGRHLRSAMFDLALGGIVAFCLAAYLVYALLHPEKL